MFIYRIFIKAYFLFIALAASFNDRAAKYVRGRKDLFKKIKKELSKNLAPIAWFHCASLGEFEQARPVIEEFRKVFPSHKILLTFFSPSGYEVRKKYNGAEYVFYLPNDSKRNAKKFVRLVRPSIAFFVKYEFWFFYLRELKKRNIPVISFSAIFRENQLFFKPYGRLYLNFLTYFDHIFVQDENSVQLLARHNLTNVSVSGDTRFDRVYDISRKPQSIEIAERFKDGSKICIMGSVWPADLEILIPLINNENLKLKYIIAPHNIRENEIKDMESRIKKPVLRYSKAYDENAGNFEVLIIDNIGLLSSLYQYGEFAYIGGAFGQGLHNTLEAAVFGMPVFFGSAEGNRRFQEALQLEHAGAAFPVKTTEEIQKLIGMLLENESERMKIGQISSRYVVSRTGATRKIIGHVKTLLNR